MTKHSLYIAWHKEAGYNFGMLRPSAAEVRKLIMRMEDSPVTYDWDTLPSTGWEVAEIHLPEEPVIIPLAFGKGGRVRIMDGYRGPDATIIQVNQAEDGIIYLVRRDGSEEILILPGWKLRALEDSPKGEVLAPATYEIKSFVDILYSSSEDK